MINNNIFYILVVGFSLCSGLTTFAAPETDRILNKIMQMSFLIKKKDLLLPLSESIQKRVFHEGAYFKGEIAEIKENAEVLKRASLRLEETPQGFLLITEVDGQKLKIKIDFIDPLEGVVGINGHRIKLEQSLSYLEVSQRVAPVVFASVNKKAKKRAQTYQFFIPSAYANESYFHYPKSLPEPYRTFWSRMELKDRFAAFAVGTATSVFIIDRIKLGRTKLDDLDRVGSSLNAMINSCERGKELFYRSNNIARQITECNERSKREPAQENLSGPYRPSTDSCKKGKDGLCKEENVGKEKIVKEEQSLHCRPKEVVTTEYALKREVNFDNSDYKDTRQLYRTFSALWNAITDNRAHIDEKVACNRLISKEKLEELYIELREKDASIQGAFKDICKAYKGVLECYRGVPSPYGERVLTHKEAVNNQKALKKDQSSFDFYESFIGGDGVIQ